jgi:hypothetical protein
MKATLYCFISTLDQIKNFKFHIFAFKENLDCYTNPLFVRFEIQAISLCWVESLSLCELV